ncbi:NUDIX hydrolase [Corynebacterium kroppenstedtii]|uniref:NUDIX hydrolase n=1 Tax=Corynebacterium sp. PCR 32 TaxID=3351342 RepID=UPI003098AAF9
MDTEFPRSFSEPIQPQLPEVVPPWLRDITQRARQGGIRRQLSDLSRRKPDTHNDQSDTNTGHPHAHRGKGTVCPSAVLILLAGDATHHPSHAKPYPDDARLLLTHRAPTLRSHSGQMAFPGGRKDPEDITPIDTALREAEEETAALSDTIDPLAVLHPILIPRTGNVVSPVVAYWRTPTRVYAASPAEVAETMVIPIAQLADPAIRMTVGAQGWKGPAFWIGNLLLWGFTGGLVDGLLREAGWEKPWNPTPVYDLAQTLARSANNEPVSRWRTNTSTNLTTPMTQN